MERQDIEVERTPIKVERQPRAGAVVSVRLTEEEVERLEDVAESRHSSLSGLVREAVRVFLGFPYGAGFPVGVTTKGELSDLKIELDPPPVENRTTGRVRVFGNTPAYASR
jgi:hypothetical protein